MTKQDDNKLPVWVQSRAEMIMFSTLRITIPGAAESGDSIGTGFLVTGVSSTDPEAEYIFLVSNRHVLTANTKRLSVVVHTIDEARAVAVGKHREAVLEFTKIGCIGHPNDEIDLACVNVSVLIREAPVFFTSLGLDVIADFDNPFLVPGLDVFLVGYPQNRFDQAHNLPLFRKGSIASHPRFDYNDKPQIVIDAQVFPGSSGSPVFVELPDESARLLGVVSQTMIRHERLEIIPVADIAVQQVLGLGLVIKASEVKTLIDHAVEVCDQSRSGSP